MSPVPGPNLPLWHSKPRRAASSTAGEPTPARYWAGKPEGRGTWGDALAPAEPWGASWALREVWMAMTVQWSSLVSAPCCCPFLCWSLVRASSHAGVQSQCCAEAGRGRVNPAQHSEGKEGPFPFCVPTSCSRELLGMHLPGSRARAVGVVAALCQGAIIWEGGERAVLGSRSGRGAGCLPGQRCSLAVGKGIWRRQQLLT